MSKYIVFKLDHQEYGVEVKRVQEIALYSAIEKSPQSIHPVSCIMESGSGVIPVYQLRECSSLNYFKRREKLILMVLVEGRRIGIIIDDTFQVEELKNLETKVDIRELVTTDKANILGYGIFNESIFVLLNSTDLLMYEKSRVLCDS